jgi:hypothetical protein
MKNTGRNTYLEWYSSKDNWSTYTAGNTNEYELSFYANVESDEDHIHNPISDVHAPTCDEAGYTSYTCKCGDTYKVDGESAIGHSYQPVVTDPTCTDAGYTTYTCANCNDSYTADEVTAPGHNYVDGTCSNCGEPEVKYLPGDVDLDGDVDVDDVLALLWHVLFPDDYPIEVDADFDHNGSTDVDDVLTLLWHVLFPEEYPI